MPQPPEWECPNCHELNPEQFDVCWNCRTTRATGTTEEIAESPVYGTLDEVMQRDAARQDTKDHLLKRRDRGYIWLPIYAALLRLLAPIYALAALVYALVAMAERGDLLLGLIVLLVAALGVIQILATADAARLLLSLDRRVGRGEN